MCALSRKSSVAEDTDMLKDAIAFESHSIPMDTIG